MFVIIFEIFTVEMCIPWPLQRANVKCKYGYRKAIYDFLFDENSITFPICYYFRDFHNQNVPDLDPEADGLLLFTVGCNK